jgi:predicted amidophosphoribosyltransferase
MPELCLVCDKPTEAGGRYCDDCAEALADLYLSPRQPEPEAICPNCGHRCSWTATWCDACKTSLDLLDTNYSPAA